MHPAPEISIIIPAVGGSAALHETVASIDPHEAVEILLVTSCVDTVLPDDPRVIPLRGAGHGPNVARNLALGVARAPLVAFMNPADRWRPGRLAAQLALHRTKPQLGLSFTDQALVTADGQDHGSILAATAHFAERHAGRSLPFCLGEDALAQVFAEEIIGTSTVMANAALLRALGGFEPGLSSGAPWDLWLRVAAVAPIACIPRVMAELRLAPLARWRIDARKRLVAMREVALRHRQAALLQDVDAVRHCTARMLVTEAELGLAA